MPDPIFSVIISTYNRKDILPRAIGSVLGQSFGGFELLVIDNGSTDDTENVVGGIKDSRLIYFKNPKPTSSCDGPRNLGIGMAKGGFVAFLDDDDIWYPERLDKVRKTFDENPDAIAVCHNENKNVGGRIEGILRKNPSMENIHEKLLYEENCFSPSGMTIKTGFLRRFGGFNSSRDFCGVADYDLWIRMAETGCKFCFINEPLGETMVTGYNWSIIDPMIGEKLARMVASHILGHEKRPIIRISGKGAWRLFQLNTIAARSYASSGNYVRAAGCLAVSAALAVRRPGLIGRLSAKVKNNKNRERQCQQRTD